MLDIKQINSEIPKHFIAPNLVLLAGAGQNVGKTSFAVELISHLKSLNLKVYALKITPHFHQSNPPNLIIQKENFQIALEKDEKASKDSSRMLQAGADEVFFVQTNSDEALAEAFHFVNSLADETVVWVCESGGLRSVVEPGLFLYFKMQGEQPTKKSARWLMPLADRIVEFNGSGFDLSATQVSVDKYCFNKL